MSHYGQTERRMAAIARKRAAAAARVRRNESAAKTTRARAPAARYKSRPRTTVAQAGVRAGADQRKPLAAKAVGVTTGRPVNGVARYVHRVAHATPLEIVEIE